MDETLRLCSQIQKTIADVDLLSEADSDHDKGDSNSESGLEHVKTHSGVGSPESPHEDMDDKTFRDQVDQLLREARDYINDDEANNEVDNDVELMVQDPAALSSQPSQDSVNSSRHPSMSMSISLIHQESLEMKGTSSCADECHTLSSESEGGFESPGLRRQNRCSFGSPDIAADANIEEDQTHVADQQHESHSVTSENIIDAPTSSPVKKEWMAEHEGKLAGLLGENAALKKERDELSSRYKELEKEKVELEQELKKVQTEGASVRADLERATAEKAKDNAELTRMVTLLSQTKVELTEVKTELVKTRTDLANVKTELSQGRDELLDTKSKLFKANETMMSDQRRMKELQKVVYDLEQQRLQLQIKETTTEKQYQDKLDEIENTRHHRNESLMKNYAMLKNRVEELESEKCGHDEELQRLKAFKEKNDKTNHDLHLQCESLRKERRELQSLCDEHEKMTDNVQRHCQTLMQEIKELKNFGNEHEQENCEMKKTIKNLTQEKEDLEQTNTTFKIDQELLEEKAKQLELTKAELTKKTQEQAEELERITTQLGAVESAGVARSTWYVEIRKEHAELTKEKETLNEKIKKLKDANSGLALELGKYKAENSEMDSQLRTVNAQITKLKLNSVGDQKAIKDEVNVMKTLLVKAQGEESSAKGQLEEMLAHMSDLVRLCAVESEEEKSLLPDLDDRSTLKDNKRWVALKKHISGIANELVTAREVSRRSKKEMNDFSVKHDDLKKKYDALCVMHLKSLNEFSLPQSRNS